MDKEEEKRILRAVVNKAEENGYRGHLRFTPTLINPTKDRRKTDEVLEDAINEALHFQGRNILFDISFQKAFFPQGEVDKKRKVLKDWKYHTARMYETNPLEYVESYL